MLLTDDEDDVGSRQNLSKEKCFTVLYEFVFFLLKSFFFLLVPEKSYYCILWNVMLWASNRVIELLCSKLQGALNSNLASPALKVGMVLVMVRTTKPWKNSEVETLTESP